jgi:hypothetical protein
MVTVKPGVWCDPCIASLVAALNYGGVETVASCCGHGERNGSIALADGRELLVLAAALRVGANDRGGSATTPVPSSGDAL